MCSGYKVVSFLIIISFCIPVQVSAGLAVQSSATEFSDNSIFSDLNINTDEIVALNFDESFGLSEFGTAIVSRSNRINAIHKLDSGNYILSAYKHIKFGDVKYESGDLFEYNPVTGQANLFFSGGKFKNNENIDAVYVRKNGNFLFSTKSDAELANVSFKNGDIVEYNPVTEQLNVIVDSSIFDGNGNVQSVHVLEDGDILFSLEGSVKLNDLKVDSADLFRFDISNSSISLTGNLDDVLNNRAIEGLTEEIPEPATIVLLLIGTLAVFKNRRKSCIKKA